MSDELLQNLDKLHTTKLGAERLGRVNLVKPKNQVDWCRKMVLQSTRIIRRGKNWYVFSGDYVITINATSYTIITLHKSK